MEDCRSYRATEGFKMLRRGSWPPCQPSDPPPPLFLMFEALVTMTTKEKPGPHDHDGGFKNSLRPLSLPLVESLHSFSHLEVQRGLELIHLCGESWRATKWAPDQREAMTRSGLRHSLKHAICIKFFTWTRCLCSCLRHALISNVCAEEFDCRSFWRARLHVNLI